MKIITNNKPRLLLYGYQLHNKWRKEFDYLNDDEFDSEAFISYRGNYYTLSDFMRCTTLSGLGAWFGYHSDSFFSSILVKLCEDSDYVIMGRYFS